jgi:hypothetical protein
VPVEGTFVERYLNDLLLAFNFPASTSLASLALLNDLSFTFTSIAVLLNLLIHTRPHLVHLHHSSFSLASLAVNHLRATLSLTGLATSDSLVRNADYLSIVALLQGYFQSFLDWFCFALLRRSSRTHSPTSEEHVHDVYIRGAIPAPSACGPLLPYLS